jgi:hypothetical protein
VAVFVDIPAIFPLAQKVNIFVKSGAMPDKNM